MPIPTRYVGQNMQENEAVANGQPRRLQQHRQWAGPHRPVQSNEVGAVMAALRAEVLACTGKKLCEQFMWQQDTGSAKKAEFMEDVVSGQAGHIKMFAFVQKGSTIVKVVHGVTRYLGRDAPELKRCVIGRVVEWTSTMTPHLVQMPANQSWEWQNVKIADDLTVCENQVKAGGGQ
eukprot:scaffold2424_cov62-Cyclotella_meneghiniana.AAC.7